MLDGSTNKGTHHLQGIEIYSRMGYLAANSLLTVFERCKTEKVELSLSKLISDITLMIRIEKDLTLFFHILYTHS